MAHRLTETLQRAISRALGTFDVAIARRSTLDELWKRTAQLEQGQRARQDLDLLSSLPREHLARLFELLPRSKSQIRQDLFVLSSLQFKPDGFFVEFGATNGVDLSNTYLLEKNFGWKGILAEPARCWHSALQRNRSCAIETRCVWATSGETLTFSEVQNPDMSTLERFSTADYHSHSRRQTKTYPVTTLSLNDLLATYNAPPVVDYLSIDTEGSEFDILAALDFDRYRFRIITCEHNWSPMRETLHSLLTAKGYRRTHESVSQFDDWWYYPGELN